MPDSERSAPADFGRVLLALIVGQIGLHATMAGVRMAAPLQAPTKEPSSAFTLTGRRSASPLIGQ